MCHLVTAVKSDPARPTVPTFSFCQCQGKLNSKWEILCYDSVWSKEDFSILAAAFSVCQACELRIH